MSVKNKIWVILESMKKQTNIFKLNCFSVCAYCTYIQRYKVEMFILSMFMETYFIKIKNFLK